MTRTKRILDEAMMWNVCPSLRQSSRPRRESGQIKKDQQINNNACNATTCSEGRRETLGGGRKVLLLRCQHIRMGLPRQKIPSHVVEFGLDPEASSSRFIVSTKVAFNG